MMRMVEQMGLAGGELISVRDARAIELIVTRGRAWVTLEGDSRDFFPRGGQSMAIPAGRRAVVEALGDAEVALRVRQNWFRRVIASGLMAMAVGALVLRQRMSGLRGMALRGGAPHGVAACRDGGC